MMRHCGTSLRGNQRHGARFDPGEWSPPATVDWLPSLSSLLQADCFAHSGYHGAVPVFRVDAIGTAEELQEALAIRTSVFVDKQHVPPNEEVDGYDADPVTSTHAVHVLGRLDGAPIATGRLLLATDAGDLPHIDRVAVLAPHRGHGYGTAIMEALHA